VNVWHAGRSAGIPVGSPRTEVVVVVELIGVDDEIGVDVVLDVDLLVDETGVLDVLDVDLLVDALELLVVATPTS
jgi:hypothetical protein